MDGRGGDRHPGNHHRMNVHQSASVSTPKSAAKSTDKPGTLLGTLAHLWPYIWPADRLDLRLRVIGALVLLLFAKLATIAVPFTFKWATDALAGRPDAPAMLHGTTPGTWLDSWFTWALAAPILLALVYGG